MKLTEGSKAPDFSLLNQEGREVGLKDFLGRKLLIYFYPKDFTSGCTKEACSIRDRKSMFQKYSTEVLGISADSVEMHKRFHENHSLNFDILSDEKKSVLKAYGVWQKKKIAGKEYMGIVRTSFLIDESGNIEKIYTKVKPDLHAWELIKDIKTD